MCLYPLYDVYTHRLKEYKKDPIPPLVHQLWLHKKGVEVSYENIPKKERALSDDVELNFPYTYTYKFWSNFEIEELWNIEELQPYKECFQKAQPHIIKCDMARYAIMYAYGGIYMDMDCSLGDRPLIADISKDQIYYYEDDKNNKVFNGYLVSRPKNPFWLLLLDLILAKLSNKDYIVHSIPEVYATSGPEMLGKTIVLLNELFPHLREDIAPFPHSEFPLKIDQPSMSSWKADLVKDEVHKTGNYSFYIIFLLLPILFLLIFIMWYWTRNSLHREAIANMNKMYTNNEFNFA